MNSTFAIKKSSVVIASLLASLGAVCLAPTKSDARAFTYGVQNHTVNCGIVLLDQPSASNQNVMIDNNGTTNGGANDPVPYLFYVLNSRTDLKPLGWKLDNPYAPHNVTRDVLDRWNARTTYDGAGSPGGMYAASKGGNVYALGQEITQNMAPYWEVPMSTMTLSSITKYNALYLRVRPGLRIQRKAAELLLAFVESGGALWIEGVPGSTIDPVNGLFFNLQFSSLQAGSQAFVPVIQTGASAPFPSAIPIRHPIISSPYLLGQDELSQLGIIGVAVNNADPTNQLANVLLYGGPAGPPVVSSFQLGAGTVTVTTSGCADEINTSVPGIAIDFSEGVNQNSGPYSAVADTVGGATPLSGPLGSGGSADLKLAFNIMSWSGEFNQSQKNSHGNASSDETFTTAIVPQWDYQTQAPANVPVPSAAIFGHTAYAVDSAGFLHGFDLIPGEHLFGGSGSDDGLLDYSQGTTYDELWSPLNVGKFASAPIVFVMPPGTSIAAAPPSTPTVALQRPDGTIVLINGLTGAVAMTLPGQVTGGNYDATTGPAPAPTFFGNRIYAGQYDGLIPKLYIYDFNPGGKASGGAYVNLYTNPGASKDFPTGPPSIAVMSDPISGDLQNPTNDIVAYVPTNFGLTTVFLGARNELLPSGGLGSTQANTRGLGSVLIDTGSNPAPSAYSIDPATGYKNSPQYNGTLGPPAAFSITNPADPGPFFGSYDVDLTSTNNSTALSRIFVARTSQTLLTAGTPSNYITSAAAVDGNGNAYYTVTPNPSLPSGTAPNSSIYCVRDSANGGARVIKWRFRLPFLNEQGWDYLDADQVSYQALAGYVFVGAPVADKLGNVWAAAYSPITKRIAILGFDSNGVPTADLPGRPRTVTGVSIKQPFPYTSQAALGTEFGSSDTVIALNPSQYGFNQNGGHITFNNYGAPTGASPTFINPNLSEPQPVEVSTTITRNGAATSGPTLTIPVHTNLAWYSILPGIFANATGLNRVGDYLYLGASSGAVNGGSVLRFFAYPVSAGVVDNQRFANPFGTDSNSQKIATQYTNLGVNDIVAPLAIANGRMVSVGTDSIAALGNQPTLIADSNRLVELNSVGDASWSVDSTSSEASQDRASGVIASANVKLNRPSAISQLSANDYLIVDTGNNRVVQIDRGGHVLWEVNRFNPGSAALPPGESTRLNQPTGCEVVKTFDAAKNATVVHYLIADAGNFRIVEISDTYDNKGNLVGLPHQVTWMSQTYASLGRKYRYQSASYYTDAAGNQFVVALVTNKRVSQRIASVLPLGQQNTESLDSQGSSIVLLDYDPTKSKVATQADGFIGYRNNAGNYEMRTTSQLVAPIDAATGKFVFGVNPTTVVPLNNPRYLKVYTEIVNGTATQGFLLAQSDGVFDMHYANGFAADWGFTGADYHSITTPIDSVFPTFSRSTINPSVVGKQPSIPFQAACLQKLGIGKYLITNSFSLGDSLPPSATPYPLNYPLFKGEAFTVSTANNGSGLLVGPTKEDHDLGGGFYSGHTFAIPANTGQVTQPLFAIQPL